MAPSQLLIYRAGLRAGARAEFDQIERGIARDCARLGFPHSYWGMEALSGAEEIWFVTGWGADAEAELKRVGEEYAKNAELVAAMEAHQGRRAALLVEPVQVMTTYREDLSQGTKWSPGMGRFVVFAMRGGDSRCGDSGTVYEGPDGIRYELWPAGTREEAETAAEGLGSGAKVFAVRPEWSVTGTK